ncbi:MAG: GIY-YIG nuclease family protein [Acidobacteria bacterium]|nr:GIY-YIG nuclease family protein [Acidobacteriota bacterium]
MAAQSFSIEFSGYWREPNKGGLPAQSGIYCVYTCVHNATNKTNSLKRLIYIGESEDVQTRLACHEKFADWEKHVKTGEQLCFNFGSVEPTNRVRCEAAMIKKHKPAGNTEYVDAFPFDQTTMALSGKIIFLEPTFTVSRS